MNFVNIPGWELQQFLTNTAKYARQTMAMIGIIIGIVTLVWGFVIIAKGLLSSNGQPTPWLKGISAIIFGGVLAFGTWQSLYRSVGSGMNKTITNMGDGTSDEAKIGVVMAKDVKLPNVEFK